jgi:alpha-mannosidase
MSLFFTEEKLRKQIGELASFRYRDGIDIEKFIFQKDESGENGAYPPVKGERSAMIGLGESWAGRDIYCWLSASVDIPAAWSGKRILGRFDFGKTGGGNNSGFESRVFVYWDIFQ